MLRAQIKVTYLDGRVVEFDGKGRLWIDFEDKFDISIMELEAKMRMKHIWWLGYQCAKTENKHGGVDFDPWADGVETVEFEVDDNPLEKPVTPTS